MDKWFEEKLELEAGRVMKIEYSRKLESVTSPYQKIEVYDTKPFGKMLVHDDVIMLTEFDEANYHEMIAHVPLCIHPGAKNVLVIGGGDGGTVREILKHPEVESVHLCEIDREVVRVSRRHFPQISSGFDDTRVEAFYQDGAEFVRQRKNHYQVIIVDSSDPIGPAEVLFQETFYRDMFNALTPDGIVVTQSESFLYHQDIIESLVSFNRRIFPIYEYYYTLVPTYPSGVIGFSFCSKKFHPLRNFQQENCHHLEGLRYYNQEIHRAAFALPENFIQFLTTIDNVK